MVSISLRIFLTSTISCLSSSLFSLNNASVSVSGGTPRRSRKAAVHAFAGTISVSLLESINAPTLEWPRTQILRASAAFDIDDGRAKRPSPQVPEMRRGRAAPRPPRQDRREGRNRLRGRRSVFEMRRHLERGHPRAETDFRATGRFLARSLREDLPRVRPGRRCDRGRGARPGRYSDLGHGHRIEGPSSRWRAAEI